MQHLMTYFGTLLCRDQAGHLSHRPATAPEVDKTALASASVDWAKTLDPLGLAVSHREQNWLAALGEADRILSATEDGDIAWVEGPPGPRERLTLVNDRDLALIDALARNHWVRRFTQDRIDAGSIRLVDGPALEIAGARQELWMATPITDDWHGRPAPLGVFVHLDGWRLEELVLFRPLVVVVAFGPDLWLFERMALTLKSLVEVGGFTGDVLVIGRLDHAELMPFVNGILPPERLHALQVSGGSGLDYCMARYRVVEWPGAEAFQPLLYVDVDVVADTPLEGFFNRLVLLDRLSAQREDFARLDQSPAAGEPLFREDGIAVGDAVGFNAGILAIPSLVPHARMLRLILATIERYVGRFGPAALPFKDQPVANYVTYKVAPIDYSFVTSFVRYTRRGRMEGGDTPLGFVHFWGSGGRTTRIIARHIADRLAERQLPGSA